MASSICKVCKEFKDSPFIVPTAIPIASLKPTLVSPFTEPGGSVTDESMMLGFNQIDLPQYSSYEMLRQQLLLAINEGGEGFGFA